MNFQLSTPGFLTHSVWPKATVIDTLVEAGPEPADLYGAFPEEIYPESIVGKRQLKNHREQIYLPELVRPRTVGSLSYRIAKNPEGRHSEVESTGSTVRRTGAKAIGEINDSVLGNLPSRLLHVKPYRTGKSP